MKGKNFSTNNTGKRKKSDLYETPYSMTEKLLERENFISPVLECACGNGAIVRILSKRGYTVNAFDEDVNFLSYTTQHHSIITNPPYSLAFEFILHAKEIATGKIAMLLPLSYLHGKQRFDAIWNDTAFPLKTIYVFTRYPMLGEPLREDGKYHTGMMVYAWYIWDKNHIGAATIQWIDNNEDVIKTKG